ncbi:MAG TPA: methionine--tRNA ligase, partial [Patescibacteria group bacterium]
MDKKFYITTPIYYINDVPHIGHTCTTVAADILARLHRQLGDEVFFLTGTDEHGQKAAEAAAKEGLTPQEYCDKIAPRFEDAWKKLNISNDFFIRTTDKRHEEVVKEFLLRIKDSGDVYKDKYEGWYCIGCEAFKTETDLVDGHCPLHPPEKTVWKSEENWFFKLSKYVPKIIELIENDETNYIFPEGKRREVLAKLKAGVRDVSISRENVEWGIPLPWEPSHTIYVWIDALINYYSATRFLADKNEFWPANLHLLAKEILWFHTVIWQAMLLSAGLALPKKTFIHSFYIVDGKKMSKSLGNVISPKQLEDLYGVDGTRYLIAKSFPTENDSDVGLARFTEKYNADLANNFGNLISRVTKLGEGIEVKSQTVQFDEEYLKLVHELRFDEALGLVFNKWIDSSNAKINEVAPWKLDKEDNTRKDLLELCITNIQKAAFHLKPFIPESVDKIEKAFESNVKPTEGYLFPRIVEVKQQQKTTNPISEEKLVIGEVVKLDKHPNADGLQVAEINVGKDSLVTIVTSAQNIKIGDIVPVVLPGGRVNSTDGKIVKIEKGKLRGVVSFGMMASELELGLGPDHH